MALRDFTFINREEIHLRWDDKKIETILYDVTVYSKVEWGYVY